MTDLKELAAELSEKTGLSVGALQPIEGGMDSSASCVRSETYFVKLRPNVPAGVLLAAHLVIPGVLSPLQIIDRSNGTKAIIYPRLDARNGFEKPLRIQQWEHVGRILRQVHDFTGPTSYLAAEPFQVLGVETMAHSPLAHLVELHWLDIAWIIKETESLGGQLSRQEWKFVPCHADLHVGNILTSEHGTWLIDWDTARLAPRECDLLFFLGNGILGMHAAVEEAAFLSGYGEVSFSPELIRYYQLARVLEDLISFAQEGDEKWFLRQLDSQLLLNAKRGT